MTTRALPSFGLLGVNLGAEGEAAAARFISFDDPVFSADDAAGGEIGAGDDFQQFGEFDIRDCRSRWTIASQISRRLCGNEIARHADGDAGGAVDQQIGELARAERSARVRRSS